MKKIVTEKTLELNICAEIISLIRSLQNCNKSFWIGMTQSQEAFTGMDEYIENMPHGYYLIFQFKSPWINPRNNLRFNFTINDRQHFHLSILARSFPHSCFYVFPYYKDYGKLAQNSPGLLNDTWFLDINSILNLPRSLNRAGTHKVECLNGSAIIHSPSIKCKLSKLKEIKGQLEIEKFIPYEKMCDWFRKVLTDKTEINHYHWLAGGLRLMCISTNST